MDFKKWLDYLSKCRWIRLRLFNIRLFGNVRWGFYTEFSTEDFISLIKEFNAIAKPAQQLPDGPVILPFTAGGNYAILARLCELYYTYEGSDKLQKKVINEVQDIIAELRNDAEAHAEFEAYLNTHHNAIMSRFRASHPAMQEKDFRLYAYLVAGFSATTIAVLLGKEKSIVYNRISRLKKVLEEEYRLP